MSELTLENLAQRVAALEQDMARWLKPPTEAGRPMKDWRLAVGTFVPTELSEEVDTAGREIREADRLRADS